MLLQVMLPPLPPQRHGSHQGRMGPRDDGVEAHGEGARAAPSFRMLIAVAYSVVRCEGEVLVELGNGHVVEDATSATYAGKVGNIVQLQR